MASQPVDGDQYFIVTGGTAAVQTVVSASPCTLGRAVIGGTYVGTVAVYDSATVSGTAATNLVATLPIPALLLMQNIDFDIKLKKGLVVDATGTPIVTLTWRA